MIIRLLTTLLIALLGARVATGPALAEMRWKAVATSRPTPQFTLWTWLAEELDKRTNGQITVELASLPERGFTGFELVRVMKAGLVDMGDLLPTYVASDVPALEGVDLPGLYKDLEASVKAHAGFMPAAKRYESKIGAVIVGAYLWPQQVIYSRKPIKSPADLDGLKLRVFGAAQAELARALGAQPVSIPVADVYAALERGTVDAALTGTTTGLALKWYEVSRYLVDINHGPVVGFVAVSKQSWDKLTPDQRAILTKLGEEFSAQGWESGRKTTRDGIEESQKKGMEWVPITPAMASAVRDAAVNNVVPSWVKRAGPDARSVFNQYVAAYAGFTIP
jgi:TRAP-type C4-dicarboxylate transport system substrate-binding protein